MENGLLSQDGLEPATEFTLTMEYEQKAQSKEATYSELKNHM